jgi:hypothetical protein
MTDEQFSDEELTAAVTFLEKAILAKGEPLPVKKGSAMNPIMPASAPAAGNRPIDENASPLDQAYTVMDERYEASIRSQPLAQGETEAMRRSKLTESDAPYREAARRAIAITTDPKASVNKADSDRRAQVAKAFEDAGEQFAKQRGISVEKARTILRRAYPTLAAIEMGRA